MDHWKKMAEKPTLHVTTRKEWREWLERNHQKETVIWLIFFKKHTGKTRLPYNDSVEEALCFGWIDSIVNRIDEDRYMQKFTPRRKSSSWSALNIRRIKKLIQNGSMTEAGMARIPPQILEPGYQPDDQMHRGDIELPPDLEEILKSSKTAWGNFQCLAPSHKRNYIGWIISAKREETRQKRLNEAIALLNQGKKLGLK